MPGNARLSIGGARQGRQHMDGGGFARPIGAEQAEELAGGDGKLQPVNGLQPAVGLAQVSGRDSEGTV